jgi:DNA modification methylase
MTKRLLLNRLNELSPKDWLKFQKSWFVHNPPRRTQSVLRHPAKFPETLAMEFIGFFTKPGQVVLDPMAGTGSTLVAALRTGRHSYGVELNPTYAEIAGDALVEERQKLGVAAEGLQSTMVIGDAAGIVDISSTYQIPSIDYMLTSPPYWDMLHMRGAATQQGRRNSPSLDVVYSEDPNDLGNILDYDEFIKRLSDIYTGMQPIFRPGAYLTIIVKNIKKGGKIYPLAWDLASCLKNTYVLKDEKIWCQDNQKLSPYGLGNAWVSNTFHHYCLQFRNERS